MADKPQAIPPNVQLRVDRQSPPTRRGVQAPPLGHSQSASSDMDSFFNKAEQALAAAEADARGGARPAAMAYELPDFHGAVDAGDALALERIRDVELDLKIELGRTQMVLEDVLKLRAGSVVPLDKMAGDPVDIVVNGRLIARGEVLVIDDNFCVRVSELLGAGETSAERPADAA